MSFDLQLVLALITAAITLYRVRPTTMLLTLNHALTLRAFQNIEAHGQPVTMWFLPPNLFASENLERAADVTGIVMVMLFVSSLLPEARPTERAVPPAIPRPVLFGVLAYFTILFFTRRTILETAYASADQSLIGDVTLTGGAYPLAWALVLIELRRRVAVGEMSARRALGWVGLATFLLEYLKGSTGLVTGVVVAAIMLIYVPGRSQELQKEKALTEPRARLRVVAGAVVLLGFVFVFAGMIRSIRSAVAREGVEGSITAFVDEMVEAESSASETGEGAEARGNGGQSAVHTLMCTFLYDNGHSREWRSVTGAFEYTFKPSVLNPVLGLTRSREAAWELGDYFVHGGGVNTFGELYWNGGHFCLVLVGGLLIGLLYVMDVRSKVSMWWLMMAACTAPSLFQGYGYGFAQTFRGVANGLVYMLPFAAYLVYVERERMKRGLALARAWTSPAPEQS